MAFLSHDLLRGRQTGSSGYEIAARYVGARFEALGLVPAGGDGTFYQWLDLRSCNEVESGCRFTLRGPAGTRELEYAVDYLMTGDPVREETTVEAPLVFVGYGVAAPDRGYDDYAGVDVEGKIVVLMRGAPRTFTHDERAFYASGEIKVQTAVDHGAVGMLSFPSPETAGRSSWERVVQNAKLPSMQRLDAEGLPAGFHPELRAGARLSTTTGVEAVFEGSPVEFEEAWASLEKGDPRSFSLPWTATLTKTSRHSDVRSCNVAALLPGSDPGRAGEFVVLTGHLDHLGTGSPAAGDSIYNGAYDNASGIAVMLEVARAFAEMDTPPRRSLLFLAVTGEEHGLEGSRHFTENPTVPLESIAANVNLDMFLMQHPLVDVIAFGSEHSTLARVVEKAVGELGVALSPDPMPEEVLFIRSDQYPFVQKGIPAIFLVGGDAGAPEDRTLQHWLKTRYHSVGDDMSQDIDFDAGADFARVNFAIARAIADAEERPRWIEGDFFGDRFGRPPAGAGD
jgi:hypothetical protein